MGFANVQAEWGAQRQQSLLYQLQPSTSSLYCLLDSGKSFLPSHKVQTFVEPGTESSFPFPFNAFVFAPKYKHVYVYKHSKVIIYVLCINIYKNIYKYVPKSK